MASQIVLRAEAKPLTKNDLRNMLGAEGSKVQFHEYNDLSSVQTLKDAFKGKEGMIILLTIETTGAPAVGHWILMLDQPTEYYHFDPYGLSLNEELSITHERPFLKELAQKADKPLRESRHRFQEFREHVNTCGRWCVFRFLHRDLSDNQFLRLFDNKHLNPDERVTVETLKLQ